MITIVSATYQGNRKELTANAGYKLSIQQECFKKPIVVSCLSCDADVFNYDNIHDFFQDWHTIEFIRTTTPEQLQSINIIP